MTTTRASISSALEKLRTYGTTNPRGGIRIPPLQHATLKHTLKTASSSSWCSFLN